ncbi:MAG: type II secretion system F family protein [Candidatus Zixiibacteriota bacterium]
MPIQFKYRAVTVEGIEHNGVLTADSGDQVENYLSDQNLIPVSINQVSEGRSLSFFGMLRGQSYENLISFTNQLATLYRAGVPLLKALSIIRIGEPKSRFNFVIDQIRASVQAGKQLSESMSEYPDIFTRVYIAGVAAGEESGKLEETLDELSGMLEREMEIGRQLKVATRYPIIVLSVIAAAFTVMMTMVIPRFVDFYKTFNADLPLPTKMLIACSNAITHYWPLVILGVVAIVFIIRRVLSIPAGRDWHDRQLLALPIFGDLIVKSNMARFALMFRILFRSGIPIVRSIDILTSTIKNTAVAKDIRKLEELFRRGQDVSLNLKEFHYIPDMALQLMAIGLESGSLDKMLAEVGNHYSKDVLYRSRQLTAALEPVLTVVLGAFVLIMALAMFLPMWNLIRVFKG